MFNQRWPGAPGSFVWSWDFEKWRFEGLPSICHCVSSYFCIIYTRRLTSLLFRWGFIHTLAARFEKSSQNRRRHIRFAFMDRNQMNGAQVRLFFFSDLSVLLGKNPPLRCHHGDLLRKWVLPHVAHVRGGVVTRCVLHAQPASWASPFAARDNSQSLPFKWCTSFFCFVLLPAPNSSRPLLRYLAGFAI